MLAAWSVRTRSILKESGILPKGSWEMHMMKWKTYLLYSGYSVGDFETIRTILEEHDIAYKYDVKCREGNFLAPGAGTVRGRFGSIGTDRGMARRYEIKIARADAEEAEYLVRETRPQR